MIQTYKLNMLPHAERTYRGYIPPRVNVSQYDKGLRTLVFELYNGANAYTLPENATAKIYGKKPDENVFEYDMTIDASGEVPTVSLDLQEQMAVIAGCVECEVRIIDGSSTVGSANFTLIVEPAPVGAEEVYSESEIPEIDNLLYGGTAGQVFTKTPTGARWADIGTDSGLMMKSEYDPNDTGSVLKADHADDASTVDGHTVARDVLANEYANEQIDSMMQAAGTVKTVNSVQPDQNGNVQISKADIGLDNVDNTSDADKPISTAVQEALDLKQDTLTFDSTPTAGSTNPVTSGGIASELSDLTDALSTKVSSVNEVLPDTNGNVSLIAEDIPAEGIGYKYAEGNPVVITDGIAEIADDLKVDFGPIQDLHGYDYPWVGGAGKNIYVGSPSFNEYNNRDRYQLSEETYNGHEVIYKSEAWRGIYKASTVKANVTYTFSAMVKCADTQVVRVFGKGERQLAVQSIGDTWTRITATFTPTEDTVEEIRVESATSTTIYLSEYQLEVGSAATSFAPYSNICPISGRTQVEVTNKDSSDTVIDSITVQLGQTVYGGTLNVTTGELTVDRAMVDLGTFDWERSTAVSHIFRDDTIPNLAVPPSTELPNAICSAFKAMGFSTISASDNGCFAIGYVLASRLVIVDHRFSNVEDFKAAMSGVQLCYELATPQTIQLTPTQLQLLEGYNILTTDGDTLNLRYIGTEASNVQAEIDEFEESTRRLAGSLAMIETSPAKASHAVGDYIILNNQLYKVIAAVSAGETLTVGTNIQYTTIADELLAILAQISA